MSSKSLEVKADYQYAYVNFDLLRNNNDFDLNKNYFFEANYTFNNPILTKPSDWQMAIASATMVSANIPISTWNDFFYVGVEFNGTLYEAKMDYIPISNNPTEDNFVFHYQQFCDSFNLAIAQACADVNTAVPGTIPSGAEPLLFWNSDLQRYQLLAKLNPWTTTSDLYIVCNSTINSRVFFAFQSFANANLSFSTSPDDIVIRILLYETIGNLVNSVPPYLPDASGDAYLMSQEFIGIGRLSTLQGLRFTSKRIGNMPEIFPSDLVGFQNGNTQQQISSQNLITDLYIDPNNGADLRNRFTYFPFFYQWHDIENDKPLSVIDINVEWIDGSTGRVYPVPIPVGSTATVKIVFRRKLSTLIEREQGDASVVGAGRSYR